MPAQPSWPSTMNVIYLPVEDQSASVAFFGSLGLHFNQGGWNANKPGTMRIDDHTWIELTPKARYPVSPASPIFAFQVQSRRAAHELAHAADAAGGTFEGLGVPSGAQETAQYTFGGYFRDPDGHLWYAGY